MVPTIRRGIARPGPGGDDLDHTGRVSRLRKAQITLAATLELNQWDIARGTDADRHCPDCGATDIGREEFGRRTERFYCAQCDYSLAIAEQDIEDETENENEDPNQDQDRDTTR